MPDFFDHPEDLNAVVNEIVPLYQREKILAMLQLENPVDADFDKVGTELTGEKYASGFVMLTAPGPDGRRSAWAAIKNEVYDYVCTKSKKYSAERSEGAMSLKNIITIIATAIAGTFGVASAVVTGAVTVALMSCIKIGKNAWCEINKRPTETALST